MYKSVRWIRTAPVLRMLLRMHNEVCTRQTQQPAASRRVRRLDIAARNLGSFQIRGHNGVMSPIYPKGGNSAADPAQPPRPQLPPDWWLQACARFDAWNQSDPELKSVGRRA